MSGRSHIHAWGALLWAALVFSCDRSVLAQADRALATAIDQLVAKNGFTANGPGVAILITRGEKLLFSKGYGLASLRDRQPLTPRTLFELASVSKTFTATAVLMLYDRGKLSLDDDVRNYVPELPQYGPQRTIRIRHLLHHTSGLPDYMELDEPPARHGTYWVNEDYAAAFAQQQRKFPLSFAPGEKYEYNNSNFMLLGLVVERISKKSFGGFLRDEIFAPAGMKHSFVYESPAAVPRHHPPGYVPAIGYEPDTEKTWREAWGAPPARHENVLTAGDGAIWCNLEDMRRWDAALREGKLLKRETMKLALIPSKTRDGETNNYGCGWSLYFDDARKLIGFGHEGSWGGFRTSFYRYLSADRTTVILSNRGDFDPDEFWYPLNELVEKHLAPQE